MSEEKKNHRGSLAPLIAQVQRDVQSYQKFLAPSEQFQKAMKKSIQPLLNIQAQLAKSVKPIIDMQQMIFAATEPMRQMQKKFTQELASVVSQSLNFQKTLNSFINLNFVKFSEALKKMPAQTRKALATLGNHGWYFDLEMSMVGLWELEKALNSGNIEDTEKALVEYFKKRTTEIEESLCDRFPDRAKIIHTAFKAHSRGEYELSVPVFLAQADGICNEIIGLQLFKKRNKIPVTAMYVRTIANDTFKAALLHPLSIPLPISASKYERNYTLAGLNRHQILHGESSSYGSEVNSLKVISLLNYVVDVLSKPEEEGKN